MDIIVMDGGMADLGIEGGGILLCGQDIIIDHGIIRLPILVEGSFLQLSFL
jgi:hypothetical protein